MKLLTSAQCDVLLKMHEIKTTIKLLTIPSTMLSIYL